MLTSEAKHGNNIVPPYVTLDHTIHYTLYTMHYTVV